VSPGHVAACHYADRAPQFRDQAGDPATWRSATA